jgi:uncharacterized protein
MQDFELACAKIDAGDYYVAFEIFERLAVEGDTSSMLWVANLLTQGKGCELSICKAIEWELKAVNAGDRSALMNLGLSYKATGDFKQAQHWLTRSLDAGDDEAALELAKVLLLTKVELKKIPSLLGLVIVSDKVTEFAKDEAKELLSKHK